MRCRWIAGPLVALGFSACTTPYDPPAVVNGSPDFQGVADLLDKSRPLELILVHGMCTHDEQWAYGMMDQVLRAIDANLKPATPQAELAGTGPGPKIQVIRREDTVSGTKLRFTALLWSPLTTPLKQQLAYDRTGTPNDCKAARECKPKRATANAMLKDWLLNDCLADALVYEGISRPIIRRAMVEALAQALGGSDAPLVLVSDSLGSKLVFDALSDMLGASTPSAQVMAQKTSARLTQVFMNANQLPILGLADQSVSQPPATLANEVATPPVDALQRYLRLRGQTPALSKLMLVAFTDPNDLLSYRLMPSRYASEEVRIPDVLVSNDKTYLGLLERPDTAHTNYPKNPAIATFTACGNPKSKLCR
jgi:hypothetical protein